MSKIFISYSRRSATVAQSLVADMEALGHQVWFDQDLSGGQVWWDRILSNIRECDALAVILDADTLSSKACELEYEYGAALKKPILPILASDTVSTNLLPHALSVIQHIDYRKQDRDAVLRLARAFATLPPSRPLPDPLPDPPAAPLSYLGTLGERIGRVTALSYEEQSGLVIDLKRMVLAPDTSDDARTLLGRLRQRQDIFAAIADEIDGVLRAPPHVPALRVTRELPDPLPASPRARVTVPPALSSGGVGALIGSLLMMGLLKAVSYSASDRNTVLVLLGFLPWGIAGALARGRLNTWVYALAGFTIGSVLGSAFAEERFLAIQAVGMGGGLGVILGAVLGVVIHRRSVKTAASTATPT